MRRHLPQPNAVDTVLSGAEWSPLHQVVDDVARRLAPPLKNKKLPPPHPLSPAAVREAREERERKAAFDAALSDAAVRFAARKNSTPKREEG